MEYFRIDMKTISRNKRYGVENVEIIHETDYKGGAKCQQ